MIALLHSDPRRGSGDEENEDWLVLLALAALTLAALIAIRRISGRQR